MDRYEATARSLAVANILTEVVPALHAAGVGCIVLKGPTIATLLYPDGGRTFGDVDLLVEDFAAAAAVLEGLGFVDDYAGYAAVERPPHATAYRRDAGEWVDLHRTLPGVHDPQRCWATLSHATSPLDLGPVTVTALNVAGRAMHIALHALQHGGTGHTGQDLVRATRRIAREDWRAAAALATDLGVAEGLSAALRSDPVGRAIADELALPAVAPEAAQLLGDHHARGTATLLRVTQPGPWRTRVGVVARAVVPSRARVRRVASSRFGRRTLIGAYVEFWWSSVGGLARAVSAARTAREQPPH